MNARRRLRRALAALLVPGLLATAACGGGDAERATTAAPVSEPGTEATTVREPAATHAFSWSNDGGARPLQEPTGVAAHPSGTILVADVASSRVRRFRADGTEIGPWARPDTFRFNVWGGLDVNRRGEVYVADSGRQRIVKLTADGPVLAAWGASGTGRDGSPPPSTSRSAPVATPT